MKLVLAAVLCALAMPSAANLPIFCAASPERHIVLPRRGVFRMLVLRANPAEKIGGSRQGQLLSPKLLCARVCHGALSRPGNAIIRIYENDNV